jgi:hypothetical protein
MPVRRHAKPSSNEIPPLLIRIALPGSVPYSFDDVRMPTLVNPDITIGFDSMLFGMQAPPMANHYPPLAPT